MIDHEHTQIDQKKKHLSKKKKSSYLFQSENILTQKTCTHLK